MTEQRNAGASACLHHKGLGGYHPIFRGKVLLLDPSVGKMTATGPESTSGLGGVPLRPERGSVFLWQGPPQGGDCREEPPEAGARRADRGPSCARGVRRGRGPNCWALRCERRFRVGKAGQAFLVSLSCTGHLGEEAVTQGGEHAASQGHRQAARGRPPVASPRFR